MMVSTFPLVGNYGVPDPKAICATTGLHKVSPFLHSKTRTDPCVFSVPLNSPRLPPHDQQYVESDQIHVSALLCSEYCDTPSHWNSKMTLSEVRRGSCARIRTR